MKLLTLPTCLFIMFFLQNAYSLESAEVSLAKSYNATVQALYLGEGNLVQAKSNLEKNFSNFNPSNLSEVYLKSESLLDRIDRMSKVKQSLNKCNFEKCDPKNIHCIDLKIDDQIEKSTKLISYCEGAKTIAQPTEENIGVVIAALRSEEEKAKTSARSDSCLLARGAESEFLLNRAKTLMRIMKRYHTKLVPGEPTDAQILKKAVEMILDCGAAPSSYCSVTKLYLEQKGSEFLKDKLHGLGRIERASNQKVSELLSRNFRGLNIAYLDSEGSRHEKCSSSGYTKETENEIQQKYKALVAKQQKLVDLYPKIKGNSAASAEYQKQSAEYQKELSAYESYEQSKLGNFKKYNALCAIRADRKYGYGGTADGHTWGSRRNLISPSEEESSTEIANYSKLKNDFATDYLKLMGTPDGALITTDAIGEKKNAFKTLNDGPQPAGPIDENVSASDVSKAVTEAISMIKKDVAHMQEDFPFADSTSKLTGCEKHLKVLAEKDPMAISKTLMDHPEAAGAICEPIRLANQSAQNRETARRVIRVGTYVAIGAGAVMTGGSLLGAAPGLLITTADLGLTVALTAGSAYTYVGSKEELQNEELLLLSGSGDPLNVVESSANLKEAKTNLMMSAQALGIRTVMGTAGAAYKAKRGFDQAMKETFEVGMTEGTIAYSSKINSGMKNVEEVESWLNGIALNEDKFKTWSEFEKVAKTKMPAEDFSKILDEGLVVHRSGKSADLLNDLPADAEKMRALVNFKAKLNALGFTQQEAHFWTKQLADSEILGTALNSNMQSCINTVLLSTTKYNSAAALETERITHGDAALIKQFKKVMAESKPAEYTKHVLAKTESQAIQLSKSGKAQYLTTFDRVSLEKRALTQMPGVYVKHGNTIYKYVKFETNIGYSNGVKTQWLLVEWSSGTFHGHPIDLAELHGACPACFH